MPANEAAALLADFGAGRIDPRNFPHRAHVEVSYELLERHPFSEALFHLARGLRQLAARAGHPGVYHETITAAFLALIAERKASRHYACWRDFEVANSDLLRKGLLEEFYEPAILQSTIARQTFVLPRPSKVAAST